MKSNVDPARSESTTRDVNRKMAKGAAWMILFKVTERLIGLVSTLILARLLIPADFGLVAIGMAILSALEIMSAFSFDLVLIQNQSAERRHYDTAWTFNLIFATANALILTVLARPCAAFFVEPRVEAIMYCLGFGAFIEGFSNIGVVAFQKDLQLHKEFRFGITKKITAFVVTVGLAFLWRNYWALLAGVLTAKVAGVLLSYWLHPYRPRPSLAARGELFHFSKWLLLNNVFIFLNGRGADFIVGKVLGTQALGLYTVAYEISNLPTTELVWPISRAVFPGYSKVARDTGELRAMFLRVISMVGIIAVPVGVGIGLVAEPAVLIMLGPKWVEAVPLMHLLAIFGVARALHGPTGSVYLACGKPNLIFYVQLVNSVVAMPLLVLLVRAYGIIGAPWAVLAALAVSMPTNYVWVMREIKLPFFELVDALWRPLTSSVLMYAAGALLMSLWPAPAAFWPTFIRLLAIVATGALLYGTSVLVLWRLARCPKGAEQNLMTLLKDRLAQTI